MILADSKGLALADNNTKSVYLRISRFIMRGTENPPPYLEIEDSHGKCHYVSESSDEYKVFDGILKSQGL